MKVILLILICLLMSACAEVDYGTGVVIEKQRSPTGWYINDGDRMNYYVYIRLATTAVRVESMQYYYLLEVGDKVAVYSSYRGGFYKLRRAE